MLSSVPVGPFVVADAKNSDLVGFVKGHGKPITVFALHVGGLNHRSDWRYVKAMRNADVCYADGVSVVVLAKLGGAKYIRRSSTTDVGLPLLRSLVSVGKERIAVVGGPEGLAAAAGERVAQSSGGQLVFATHGYHDTWDNVLREISALKPDVLIVGMGMPTEAIWVDKYRDKLGPIPLIMTCGGWLGFITGDEKRAPGWLRSVGLEWIYRLRHSRGRLLKRYARGVISVLSIAPRQVQHRHSSTETG